MTSTILRRLAAVAIAAASIAASAQPAKPAPAACRPGPPAAVTYGHRIGALTPAEMAMARRAWRYFENNTQPSGLANAVDNYPSTTMWDTASYLAAIVSARELGILTPEDSNERMRRLFETLGKLDLFRGEMPNKVYNTATLAKSDYGNNPGEIGFSALDLGRLLIWLKIAKERYPVHADAIDRVVLRWKFEHVVDKDGMMFGAIVQDGKTLYVQEGRLGYEEYSARGFELWGFKTDLAARAEPYATLPVYCVEVPYDARDPRKFQQHNYVVSESYVLDGIEFNWDTTFDRNGVPGKHSHPWMAGFAHRVYQAQENRWRSTGILTARSEHQLDADPYFVYDTVFTDGYAWNTITDTGRYVPEYAAVSLKAALGLWTLWNGEYGQLLFRSIENQFDERRGYYEGLLENGKGPIKAFTANNNGIMLQTLLFKAQGKLLKWGPTREGLWERSAPSGPNRRVAAACSTGVVAC